MSTTSTPLCRCTFATRAGDELATANYREVEPPNPTPHLQFWASPSCPDCGGTGTPKSPEAEVKSPIRLGWYRDTETGHVYLVSPGFTTREGVDIEGDALITAAQLRLGVDRGEITYLGSAKEKSRPEVKCEVVSPAPASPESLPSLVISTGVECPACHRHQLAVMSDGQARCFGCGNAERMPVEEESEVEARIAEDRKAFDEKTAEYDAVIAEAGETIRRLRSECPHPTSPEASSPTSPPIQSGWYRGMSGMEYKVTPHPSDPTRVSIWRPFFTDTLSVEEFRRRVIVGIYTYLRPIDEEAKAEVASPGPIRRGRYRGNSGAEYEVYPVKKSPGKVEVAGRCGSQVVTVDEFAMDLRNRVFTYLGPAEPEPKPSVRPLGTALLLGYLDSIEATCRESGVDTAELGYPQMVEALADELEEARAEIVDARAELVRLRGQVRDALSVLRQTEAE